jgi:S-DNA-T family DNA segregation ATPase FtsK/SpoIIIE
LTSSCAPTGTSGAVTLHVGRPDATVGDLATALGWRGDELSIDGSVVPAATSLVASGLRRGSLVARPAGEEPAEAVAALRWESGPDAGTTHLLTAGPAVIGRAPGVAVRCREPATAAYAGIVRVVAGEVTVTPLATAVEAVGRGRWRVGSHIARIDGVVPPAVGPMGRRRADWTMAWNRPPRAIPPGERPSLRPVDSAAAVPSAPPGGGPGGALTSLVGGALIAVFFHQPAVFLFGAVGAVAAIGRWAWQQRRHRRQRATARRTLAAEQERFERELAGAMAHEVARRGAVSDLAAAVEIATRQDRRLWERRPGHDDFMAVCLGRGDVPWTPPVDGGGPAAPVLLAGVPVGVTLGPGTVLGLVGDLAAARAVARSLVVQAVVASGPADLALGVSGAEAEWSWAYWLPHRLAAGAEAGARLRLTVLDGPAATGGLPPGSAGLVIAPDPLDLPSACTHVVHVDAHARLRLVTVAGGPTLTGVAGAGASCRTALAVARALGGLGDPEWEPDGELPAAVALGDMPGVTREGAELAVAWRTARSGDHLVATIGVAAAGPFAVDLVADGPHALVAGTTGAGKSELPRALD